MSLQGQFPAAKGLVKLSLTPLFGYLTRRTSCGQPQASANLPAHCLAACLSATSITANPPRNWGFRIYGPSVKVSVPLVASALKAFSGSSSSPRETGTEEVK